MQQTGSQTKVTVRAESIYLDEYSNPKSSEYLYCYKITIKNESDEIVQLLNRHWIIIDGDGKREDVRGPGVLGQQPQIAPGEQHQYYSFCNLQTNFGTMEGEYEMIDSQGEPFLVMIPRFYLATNLFQFPGAKFRRGQVVEHIGEKFTAVIVDYDMYFMNDEELYHKDHKQPAKDRPWYYVLVDNTDTIGYLAEESLKASDDELEINHPLFNFFFEDILEKNIYRRSSKTWEDLRQS
jgi:ApaG protein